MITDNVRRDCCAIVEMDKPNSIVNSILHISENVSVFFISKKEFILKQYGNLFYCFFLHLLRQNDMQNDIAMHCHHPRNHHV